MAKSLAKAIQFVIDKCNMANPYALYASDPNMRTGKTDSEGNVYYDCSSLLSEALTVGGFFDTNPWFATSGECDKLLEAGWTEISNTSTTKQGDIGWIEGHTEMCYEGGANGQGIFMGAHTSHAEKQYQVSIGSSTGSMAQHKPWTRLFRYKGTGISAYVVAAMCGCWKRESGVNPGIWESLTVCDWDFQYDYTGKGGYGLGQWTNVGTPHGRCYNLHTWVTSNGYSDGQGTGQLAFVVHEAHWTNSSQTRGDYTSLDAFMKSSSKNIDDLVWDFLANWEGVPGNAYDERLEAAKYYLDYIEAHKDDDKSGYSWTSKNAYLGYKSTEQMQNVMLIYWWYSENFEGGGDVPTPPWKKKKNKFWVYLVANKIIK